MTELFYYADRSIADNIQATGYIQAGHDGLIWAYDMSWPIKAALGDTTPVKEWGQVPVRFRLLEPEVMIPWRDLQLVLHPNRVWQLELAEGAQAGGWYASSRPRLAVEIAPY